MSEKIGSIDTLKGDHSVVAFAFGEKGLMADVSVEGAKFTKTQPKEKRCSIDDVNTFIAFEVADMKHSENERHAF